MNFTLRCNARPDPCSYCKGTGRSCREARCFDPLRHTICVGCNGWGTVNPCGEELHFRVTDIRPGGPVGACIDGPSRCPNCDAEVDPAALDLAIEEEWTDTPHREG